MIRNYMPAYLLLLLLCFYFYYADIFRNADWLLTLSAYSGTTLFFMLAYFISGKKKAEQISKIEELIRDLEQLEKGIDF